MVGVQGVDGGEVPLPSGLAFEFCSGIPAVWCEMLLHFFLSFAGAALSVQQASRCAT